jgi:phage terminase Nu1 subunit (DNA packaging protein)
MQADFDLDSSGHVRPSSGWGGARRNSGPKPKGYVKPDEIIDLDKARARNEQAKAELNELKLKVETGEYVSRDAVRQASATMLATLSQALRSLPDNLERKFNLAPDVLQFIGKEIDALTDGMAQDLSLYTDEQ